MDGVAVTSPSLHPANGALNSSRNWALGASGAGSAQNQTALGMKTRACLASAVWFNPKLHASAFSSGDMSIMDLIPHHPSL